MIMGLMAWCFMVLLDSSNGSPNQGLRTIAQRRNPYDFQVSLTIMVVSHVLGLSNGFHGYGMAAHDSCLLLSVGFMIRNSIPLTKGMPAMNFQVGLTITVVLAVLDLLFLLL